MYKEIFEKLKFAYLLSDEDIIKKLDISPNQYKKILEAKEIPYDILLKIKKNFNISLDYLISGKPTQDDEKILNKSLTEKDIDKLMFPAIEEIKEKIKKNGFEKYWEKINPRVYSGSKWIWFGSRILAYNLFIETHGNKPITFVPWEIFDLSDLEFWDFCKANFKAMQNKEKDLITWNDYEKYFIKQGYAIYIIKPKENQTKSRKNASLYMNIKHGIPSNVRYNDSCAMNPKWIDRCLTTLKGEKLEEKNLEVYNFELTKLTSYSDASKWDFELIDKLLRIGAIYLKRNEIRTRDYDGGSYTSRNEFELDYVMTEFIKSLVEKNLKK